MFQRLLHKPLASNKSFFLFGPRGTGKTSWLKNEVPESLYFDLLEAKWRTIFLANPQRLAEYIPPEYTGWIILDEVQKVPDLLNEIHRLIETKKYKFILSGSSARALRKKGINLLGGRALTYHMYPLVFQELKERFDLKQYLQYGGLPSIYVEENPKDYLYSYIFSYIYEEILAEGLSRQLDAFARFLESASFSQGAVLNMSAISRDCGVTSKTVGEYFNILTDLMMGYQLPAFTRRAKRRIIQHSKFYFFDVGVFRIIRPKGPMDSEEEIDGPALETLFLQHLRAINEYYNLNYSLHYWRTSNGTEVDFVLYGELGLIAIEIKRKSRIDSVDLRGLKEFLKDYPEAKAYIIYGGDAKQYFNDIVAIPLKMALETLPELLRDR